MSKNNKDFFTEKKEWSKAKDSLLGSYLKPYFTKILSTGNPVIYIDSFAGAGKYGDSTFGSPIIALETVNSVLKITKTQGASKLIELVFVEKSHYDDLCKNINCYIEEHNGIQPKIIQGCHEEQLIKALENKKDYNVFLYIDPFGVKQLDFALFEKLSEMEFSSIELLVNFNSYGFFRWACSALNVDVHSSFSDESHCDDISFPTNANEANVTKIAGGSYWKYIILRYKHRKITAHVAESQIALLYKRRLMKCFRYALDIPLRAKSGHPPKYRMFHVCNHHEGCYLMAEDMQKRSHELSLIIQKEETQDLFDFSGCTKALHDGEHVEPSKVRKDILSIISHFKHLRYKELVARYVVEYGLINDFKIIRNHLENLTQEGIVKIDREPLYTKTGKLSSFWSDTKKEKVHIVFIES